RILLSFVFDDPATNEIYTLSLHDALPIWRRRRPSARSRRRRQPYAPRAPKCPGSRPPAGSRPPSARPGRRACGRGTTRSRGPARSEEHTSELQSQSNLVCRLLLEKKKKKK